jgi:hypothetical protein
MPEKENEGKAVAVKPFADLVGDEVFSFILDRAPTKVKTRISRALDHYTRASALVGVDEEMGAIRLIAAEEELVIAIFECLKLKEDQFPEYKDFVRKFKNHVVKLSFYPVLSQFRFIYSDLLKNGFGPEGMEDVVNWTAKPVVEGEKLRLAIMDAEGKEVFRHNPLAVDLTREGARGKEVVPLMLKDFEELVRDQHGLAVKEFLKKRAGFRDSLLYATDAASMGLMEDTLGDLIEEFKRSFHDLLWVLALLMGSVPPSKEWGLVSQFIGLYREVLITAGVIRPDNTIVVSPETEGDLPAIADIVEIMARADVDYFWKEGGGRFEKFEKPIADGVRQRMKLIVAALGAAGFAVQKSLP